MVQKKQAGQNGGASVNVALLRKKEVVGQSAWALVKVEPVAGLGKKRSGAAACSFAVDCSGSMGEPASKPDGGVSFVAGQRPESKMDRVKAALALAAESMGPQDMAGITAFSSAAAEVFPMTKMDEEGKRAFLAAVEGLRSGGSTALHDGWAQAGKAAAKGLDEGMSCRVVLLTDGEATDGERNPEELGKRAAALMALGVETSCFGVGAMFNEDLLCAMSEAGGGNFRYIPDAVATCAALKAEAEGLASVSGKSVRLRAVCGQGAASAVCANGLKAEGDALVLPNLVAGRPFEALFEIAGVGEEGQAEVSFELSWTDAEGAARKAGCEAAVEFAAVSGEPEDQEVAGAKAAVAAAKEKERLAAELMRGDMAAAGCTIANIKGLVGSMGAGYSKLGRECADLNELCASFETGDANTVRKSAVYQSYSALRNQSVRDDEEQAKPEGAQDKPA